MWSDGHGFPSYGYPGLERQSGQNITGLHWKLRRLIELLKFDFCFDDRVHSFRHPPLWLRPEGKVRNRKHLIFAEFLFIPEEVCRQLDAGLVKFGSVAKKKWTGSALGYFPIRRRRRTGTEQSALDAIHFILFYPFLVFELKEEDRRRRIAQKRHEIEEIRVSQGLPIRFFGAFPEDDSARERDGVEQDICTFTIFV